MSGQRRELVYIYRAPPLALAGLDALAGSVLLFRPMSRATESFCYDEYPSHSHFGGSAVRPLQPCRRGARGRAASLHLGISRRAAEWNGVRDDRGASRGLLAGSFAEISRNGEAL
jgi:hypothetical protein